MNGKIFKKINITFFREMYEFGPLIFDFEDKKKLFNNHEAINTTIHIVKKIKKENKKSIMIIIPSQLDFYYYRKYNKNYYNC